MNERLILITTNYPFVHNGGEVTFIAPEVQRLARVHDSVTVVPQFVSGAQLSVPDGVVVDCSLGVQLARERWLGFLLAPLWPGFWAEFSRALRSGGLVGCARVFKWAAQAQIVWRWLKKFDPQAFSQSQTRSSPTLHRQAFPYCVGACKDGRELCMQPDLCRGEVGGSLADDFEDARQSRVTDREIGEERRLYYTYWRGGATMACARLAKTARSRAAITRVHGYDLYEDRFTPPFQPWTSVYRNLSLVVAISAHGYAYLADKGVPTTVLHLSRLGTERAPGRSRASTDGTVRLVSCSFLLPIKCVPKLAEAVCEFARTHEARAVHWTHFGDGPDRGAVELALRGKPRNLTVDMPGHVDNLRVLQHYADHPVDAFLLLSNSEGLPVSLQEAASAGIPVVATNVGGVSEIVGRDNGVLVQSPVDTRAVAQALEIIIAPLGSPSRMDFRDASLDRWVNGFDAESNHSKFAILLKRLLQAT